MSRTARIERQTKETKVLVEVNLDGAGRTSVSTGVGFYDHMLDALGRHSLIDLTIETVGDTHIDPHHTVEDTAIAPASSSASSPQAKNPPKTTAMTMIARRVSNRVSAGTLMFA